jgi:N-acetylglutamate synthase-like GNAT family acetyltransferase
MTDIEITTDPARIDVDLVHRFLSESSYWAQGRSRETVERSIRHSLCFSVFLDGQQVGFARVASDRAVFAYLMDVFILPAWRGRGLSKRLMRAILEHPELQGLKLFLLRTSDAHGLYAQFGFEPVERPENLMALQSNREETTTEAQRHRETQS